MLLRVLTAIILAGALLGHASAQKTFEDCRSAYDAKIQEIGRKPPPPKRSSLTREEVSSFAEAECKASVPVENHQTREFQRCYRTQYRAFLEKARDERKEAQAAVAAMVIEGYKGPQRDRLAREAAEAEYRNCTELLPYPVTPGVPCNGKIITETETDRNGRDWSRDMCYPYAPSVRSIPRTWNVENIDSLKVAFRGGSPEMRRRIKEIADDWASVTHDPNDPRVGLRFNFGRMEGDTFKFHEWTPEDKRYAANIRIAFEPDHGYWSMIGTQSDDPSLMLPGEPSMNLGGMADENNLPSDWQRTVYHEFGHARGLQHEHQHPGSLCGDALRLEDDLGYELDTDSMNMAAVDAEGRRPGVFTIVGNAPWGWRLDDAKFNFAQLNRSQNYDTTDFDPNSIMKYELPAHWYKDDAPQECLPTGNLADRPSEDDYAMIRKTYRQLLKRRTE